MVHPSLKMMLLNQTFSFSYREHFLALFGGSFSQNPALKCYARVLKEHFGKHYKNIPVEMYFFNISSR